MEQVLAVLGDAIQSIHPFVLYLVGMNVLTFVLFAIDYAIVCRNQDPDTGLMDGRILTLFALAGGALGMLVALAIFTRLHMNKANIAWWFSAIMLLIVWVLVVLVWAGVIELSPDLGAPFNIPVLVGLGVYLLLINVVTFAVFCLDKKRAVNWSSRFPEAALLGLSLAGGSLGGIVAMRVAHHKTSKWYFTVGLPAFIVLHAVLFFFAHSAGIV